MFFFAVLGLIVWYFTYKDFTAGEADSVYVISWFDWLDFKKGDFPLVFWIFLSIQFFTGLILILIGFEVIDVDNLITRILTSTP